MADKNYGNNLQLAELMKYISDNIKFPLMGAGGGFAPIGTVAYFDGTQAPVGWLLCNGGTHNITDYPELAAYFASHHGRSNYYGGNGTTTFGVPLQKGMPNNEDVNYNTSEHIVGVWTDGKPVYEKVVNFGAMPNNTTKSVNHGISNLDTVVDIKVVSARTDTKVRRFMTGNIGGSVDVYMNDTQIGAVTNADRRQLNNTFFILYYTKTTDSAVAAGHSADGKGVFCIKATVAGDPNGHVYSTEEHVVGRWINGKPLYEKTITGTTPSASGEVSTGLSGISEVFLKDAFIKNNAGYTTNISYFSDTSYNASACVKTDGTTIYFVLGAAEFKSRPFYVTIRYTKTTD